MQTNKKYDYCIIGGGPSGLTSAWYLSKLGFTCCIIDSSSVVGGCHRVSRTDDNQHLFTEHGPRVYSNAFLTFKKLLEDMGMDFNTLFTPYKFSLSKVGTRSLSSFTFSETMTMTGEFIKLCVNKDHGKDMSMKSFMKKSNFTDGSVDYIDRVCSLTDGGDSSRYTVYKFLQLINQQFFYSLYQPTKPNDEALFQFWRTALEKTGKVDFFMNSRINSLKMPTITPGGVITHNVDIFDNNNNNKKNNYNILTDTVTCTNVIVAIPPIHTDVILQNSPSMRYAFGKNFSDLAERTNYSDYIPITFHWDSPQITPDVWGFPASDWGIVFILLTDYMKLKEPESRVLLSVAITRPDVLSGHTFKTANQSSENDMIKEVFRQIRTALPNLEEPTRMILSPEIYKDTVKCAWKSTDTAFMATPTNSNGEANDVGFASLVVPNFYTCGTHNGKSRYAFTTIESAVVNSIEFVKTLHPETDAQQLNGVEVSGVVNTIFWVLLVFIVITIVFSINWGSETKNKKKIDS